MLFFLQALLHLIADPLPVVRDPITVAAPAFSACTPSISQDEQTLLTAGDDGTFQIWRLPPKGEPQFLDSFRLDGFGNRGRGDIMDCELLPDGNRFAVYGGGMQLAVWSWNPLKELFRLPVDERNYRFDPYRPWYYTGHQKIDLTTGTRTQLAFFPTASVPGSNLLVSPAGVEDGVTGQLLHRWVSKIDNVDPVSISPDGKYAIVGEENPNWIPPARAESEAAYVRDQYLRTWRIADGRLLATMPGFSANANPALLWLTPTRLKAPDLGWIRDAKTGKAITQWAAQDPWMERHLRNQVTVTFSKTLPQRRELLQLPDPGISLKRFKVQADGALEVEPWPGNYYQGRGSSYKDKTTLSLKDGRIAKVPFDPLDPELRLKWLVDRQKSIMPVGLDLVSNKDGSVLWHIDAPYPSPMSVDASKRGDKVAYSLMKHEPHTRPETRLYIATLSSGKVLATFPAEMGEKLSFSPDGTKLAILGYESEGIIDLGDPTFTRRPLEGGTNPFDGGMDDVCVQWTPDGKKLILCNSLRPIQVFDTASGRLLATMRIFQDQTWLAIRSDGAADGSPSRTREAKVFTNGKWEQAKTTPFFEDLIAGQ